MMNMGPTSVIMNMGRVKAWKRLSASAACRLPAREPGAWRRAAKEGKGRIPEYRRSRMPDRQTPLARTDFRLFRAIATRWMDNDVYGHVNNVVYYSYFDTAVNGYLVEAGLLDIVG